MKRGILFLFAMFFVLSWGANAPVSALEKDGGWKLKFVMKGDKSGGRLLYPTSMFMDELNHKYYVVDSGNNRLLSFDKDGKPLGIFTAGNKLVKPVAMAKSKKGRLLVLEKGKGGITKIDLAGKSIAAKQIVHGGKNINPQKIRYSNEGSYVLDKTSGTIFAISSDNTTLRQYLCNSCVIGFIDFQLTNNGLMALAQQDGKILSFKLDGSLQKTINLVPKPEFPVSFALSKEGSFFVLERHAGRISVYNSGGTFQYSIFTKGEKEGGLYYPIEVQFDPWGRLCVVEEGNGRVAVFEQ